MRQLFLILVILGIACPGTMGGGAMGAIVVDGDISDWPAGSKYADVSGDCGQPALQMSGGGDILSWGAVVQDGVLYAYLESAYPEFYLTAHRGPWAGLWIDVDNSATTSMYNLVSAQDNPGDDEGGNIGHEWHTSHRGIDINCELAFDGTTGGFERIYLWSSPENGGETEWGEWVGDDANMATTGAICEFSLPTFEIAKAMLAAQGVDATVPLAGATWKVGARMECYGLGTNEGEDPDVPPYRQWGGDNSETVEVIAGYVPLPGDANHDGIVNDDDATVLADNWLMSGAAWEDGDFTGDGNVDEGDVTILAANWQGAAPVSGIPEPGSALLLASGLAVLLIRRKR